MQLFKALRRPAFALLWSGQTISRLGDSLYRVALAWWVVEKTGSAVAMGVILTFTIVPMLVLLLLGGVLVDRLPRLPLLLGSDAGSGILVTAMALLSFGGWLEVWQVCLFALFFGAIDAFFHPAYRALLPEITPGEDLTSANSLTSLSEQLCGIIGPALGAFIVALVGSSTAFALNAASFFVSVACLLPLVRLGVGGKPARKERKSILADMGEGLATVFKTPWIWITIGVAALSNITYSGPMDVALPFLVKNELKADVSVLGLFASLSAIGALAGALLLGQFKKLRRRGWLLYGSWAAVGLAVAVIGLPVGVGGVLTMAFIIGACNSILGLVWVNLLQELVPTHLLGRISSIDYLGSYLFLPLGYSVGGWATEGLGAPLLFIIGGLLSCLLVGAGLLHPQIRKLD